MADTADSLVLVNNLLSISSTHNQRETEATTLKTEALLHIKLSIS